MGHNRDQWNAEAVLVALYPWEVDIVERALTCLAELASAHPDWDREGSPRGPALAILEKLDEVLEYQGHGGLEGVRQLLASRRGDGDLDLADDLLV